jgi:dipeptidyl aminopeptidase/acylaminoacyl peptidase
MGETVQRPYGWWSSPITPRSLAEDRRLEAACWDCDGETLVWLEGRSGRGVLVCEESAEHASRDLTPEWDVRAEVGYGGGDFTVHGGFVYFVVHKSGRIYRQSLDGGTAQPITPPFGKAASPVVSPDGRWVAYVHHDEDGVDRIAVVDSAGKRWPQPIAEGRDFYMQPRWSPDGKSLAWVAWDHPNMPWDGTSLLLAAVHEADNGLVRLEEPHQIAGGPNVAVFQPEFTPDGRQMLYISDETGWGRIALHDLDSGHRRWLTKDGEEYAAPAWLQGMRSYAVSADGRFVAAARNQRARVQLVRVELSSGRVAEVEQLSAYGDVAQVVACPKGDRVVMVASGATIPPRIVEFDFVRQAARIVARASAESVPPAALARCEAISWPTTNGETAHGLFYAPASDRFVSEGKPPLVVMIHGGPTSQYRAGWNAQAQFFATRGYAVLLVNYRGSTGYGRQYMLKLRKNWGVCDVEDAVAGSRHLAEAGRIDAERTVIMGGSAGGFTVLQAMTQMPEAFTAGVCLYGVANQFHLAAETHKFEAHYLDSLLGPLPEASPIYRQRSPLYHAHRIKRPMAIFQGDIDRVVPRQQSDMIVEALQRNRTPHVYHVYEGEGHGWRKTETIEHFYQSVESFLRQHVLYA